MAKEKPKKNKKADAADRKIAELEEKLAEVTKEKDDLFEQLQRVSADYANFQKRVPKQIADSVSYQKKDVLRSILPSLDNLEHALAAADKAETIESVVEGVQLTFDHMLDALKAHKVEKIEALGKEFDPAMHEAMMRREEKDKSDNIVLEEFQSGYMMGDTVLRPTKVIVNKIEEEATEEVKDENDQGEDKGND
jgi:molecular chaperone GrpE